MTDKQTLAMHEIVEYALTKGGGHLPNKEELAERLRGKEIGSSVWTADAYLRWFRKQGYTEGRGKNRSLKDSDLCFEKESAEVLLFIHERSQEAADGRARKAEIRERFCQLFPTKSDFDEFVTVPLRSGYLWREHAQPLKVRPAPRIREELVYLQLRAGQLDVQELVEKICSRDEQ